MKFLKQMVVAHRGASGLVKHENTIEAFQKAIDVKADCIEIDIRKTSDNKIVVFHDSQINGTPILALSYEQLLNITKEIGFHVPTLQETLAFVKGKILIDIEFKEAGYEKEAVDIIHQFLTNEEFYVRSFLDEALIEIKKVDPKIITALLLGKDKPKNILLTRISELFPFFRILRTNCDFVSPHYQLLKFGYILRMKILGRPVSVWTVNTEKLMKKMFRKKVGAIVTNYPDLAIQIRDRKKNL